MEGHSVTLFAQFQANLNQYPRLTRELVYQVARDSFEDYSRNGAPPNYDPLILSAQFRANLNQYPRVDRDMVFQIAVATIEHYFEHLPPVQAPARPPAQVPARRPAQLPDRWPQILSSREYGLRCFFKDEAHTIQTENPNLNNFQIDSQLRNQFEATPQWLDYLAWVRANHPQGPGLQDPSPRRMRRRPLRAPAPAH